MLKWTALALLITAALVAALYLGGDEKGSDALEGAGGLGSTTAPTEGPDLYGARGVGQSGSGGEEGTRTAIDRDPGRVAKAPGSTEQLAIQVLDSSGRAFPGGAELWVLDRDSRPAAEWQAAFRSGAERAAYVREHGRAYRSDGEGLAQIQRVSSGAVLALGAGHRGEAAWMGPVAGPVNVRMEPLMDLRVQVLDSAGLPVASAPVAVFTRLGSAVRALTQRVTRTNGEAPFPGLAKILATSGKDSEYFVALDLPVANPEELPLIPGSLPEEALVLHMPPAAPMQINVLDGNGQRVSTQMTLAMGRIGAGDKPGTEAFTVTKRHVLRHGQLTLNWVEVGAPFAVELSGGGDRAKQVFRLQGPPVPDALHTAELVWDARHPMIVGRCLGPEGQPLALAAGSMGVSVDGELVGNLGFSCDAKGVFRMRLNAPYQAGTQRVAALVIPQTGEGPPLVASRDLAFEVPPGETDLGDIVFEGLPFALSGVVSGVDGSPLLGVVVSLEQDEGGNGSWVPALPRGDQTGVDGVFALHGVTDASRLRLVARRKGYLTSTLEGVSLGEQDLRLTLAIDPNVRQEEPKDKQ